MATIYNLQTSAPIFVFFSDGFPTLWTNNLNRTMQFAKQLHTGIVWVNTWMLRDLRTPFGGKKDSGVGREGGFEALRFFTEPKNICIKY